MTSTVSGTLAAGASKTFGLLPAETVTLTLSPNVRVVITETPAAVSGSGVGGASSTRVHRPELAGTFTYGPYPMGGSVVVEVQSNSGSSVRWLWTSTYYGRNSSGDVTGLVDADGNTYAIAPPKRPRLILKRCIDEVGITYANSGTAATPTVDTASPFGGSAIKLSIPSGNTYTEIQLAGNTLANFNDHIVWRVWIEDATKVTDVKCYAGTTSYGRYYQRTYLVSSSDVNKFNGEHFIGVGPKFAAAINTFVTGTDTMADMKLRITTSAATNVWIERIVVHGNQSPRIVFTFDDCVLSHYTKAYPKLAQYRFKGAFGINSGGIGGSASLYMSAAQILEMANAGQEIYSHNVANTNYPTQNAATYTAAFRTGLNALLAITPKVSSLYHPWVQGGNGIDVQATMKAQGVQIMRGINNASDGPHNLFADGVGNRNVVVRANQTDNRTLASMTADVDDCITYGSTMFFMTHELVTTTPLAGVETSLTAFEGLVDYVAARRGQVQVLAISEIYDEWRRAGYISQ